MCKRPPRSQLIAAHVIDAITRHHIGWQAFADAVVTHYHATTDVEDRVVEFHVATTADRVERAMRNNTQTLRRILSGEQRMPSDLEESLLAAMPEGERDRLLSAMLERSGLMLARKPQSNADGAAQVAPACELMRTTAGAIERLAPLLADNNRIGPEDSAHLAKAQRAVEAVMGACITINAQILCAQQALPQWRITRGVH